MGVAEEDGSIRCCRGSKDESVHVVDVVDEGEAAGHVLRRRGARCARGRQSSWRRRQALAPGIGDERRRFGEASAGEGFGAGVAAEVGAGEGEASSGEGQGVAGGRSCGVERERSRSSLAARGGNEGEMGIGTGRVRVSSEGRRAGLVVC